MNKILAVLISSTLTLSSMSALASPYRVDAMTLMASPPDGQDQPSAAPLELPGTVPQTSYVQKGQKAPFEGVLLNPKAAAEVQIFREQAETQCDIRVEREVELSRATLQYEIDMGLARLDAETRKRALEDSINKQHIAFISLELKETQKRIPKRNWGPVWFAGGVVSGVLVVLAGAYAIQEVRQNP